MISRRTVVLVALAGGAAAVAGSLLLGSAAAVAQDTAPAATVLRLALSSARMQARAADLVLKGDVRPEARQLAEAIAAFRRGQIARLEAVAAEHGIAVPGVLEFEHQVQLDNLAPLDFLALARRFGEVELQALEQERAIWQRAAGAAEPWLTGLAGEMLPRADGLLGEARKAGAGLLP